MPLFPRSSRSFVAHFLLMVAVGPWASGCRRVVRADLGADRTVEAGVPVELGSGEAGAQALTWEPGDGTPSRTGSRLSHAFARAGTFTVRALHEGQEVGSVRLTVVPRPLPRAVPSDARSLLWVPRLQGNVEPLVDFYERLVGPDEAEQVLREAPLVSLVLNSLTSGASVVDPEEGFGLFLLPGFDGVVALLGVTEPDAALAAVAKELEAVGHEVTATEDGAMRVTPLDSGEPMLLFVDRGYLYLAIPDAADEDVVPGEGEPVEVLAQEEAPAVVGDVEVARRAVLGLSGEGLSESALLTELRPKVAEGNVYLYSGALQRAEDAEEAGPVRGFFASLTVQPERLVLDGFLSSTRPLLQGADAPASALLADSALGPVAAAQLSVPPEELAKLAFGAPGSPHRERTVERWRARGLDAEALLKALRGDVAMLVYFDAPGFLRGFVQKQRPEPKGTVLIDAGLTSAEPVLRLLDARLRGTSLRFSAEKVPGGKLYRTLMWGYPVQLKVGPERATLVAGESLDGRPRGDVGRALRERFGGETFGAGHMSVMADLGQLRADLEAQESVPGVSAERLASAQALVKAVMEGVTPLDSAFLDFSLAEGGARLKGSLRLREDARTGRGWQ
ncbi:PKD domain-containing protein [Myxococcus sp. CA056]|uniref:PKD domain-containing protein n=1 Tax=Myxococcus sp. CA056 TaxID=2741740 RepID=UPI00157B6D3D|nr:PKD domain-containing protein [Myxococcus sp. CA056]NTX13231.1 PKD domain-containing protein [Myxococcus sp. CA056]